MEQNTEKPVRKGPVCLNLGCGFVHKPGFINVDKYDICQPDMCWDLNKFPYPWDDFSVDNIEMWHVLEHLDDWWGVFLECARILKLGGTLDIRVPDESSRSALTYRDHLHVFARESFHGIQGRMGWGANAWAYEEDSQVPLEMIDYKQVPHREYYWMLRWPCRRILRFCSDHLRNFVWEQRFLFRKVVKQETKEKPFEIQTGSIGGIPDWEQS